MTNWQRKKENFVHLWLEINIPWEHTIETDCPSGIIREIHLGTFGLLDWIHQTSKFCLQLNQNEETIFAFLSSFTFWIFL
jgi:hypothetical protein